jgi:drug/metabolite transporter (DMT)-like permease
MTLKRILGIVLSIAGVALLVIGLDASHSLPDRVSEFFGGRFTHGTMAFIIAGTACTAIGLLLVQFDGRAKTAWIIPPDA